MKKSLLLLSLLVSVNIFSVKQSIPKSELDKSELESTSHGQHRKAGETKEEYVIQSVNAHQPAELKYLNEALAVTKTTASSRQTRKAQRRAQRRAASQAARAKTAPVAADKTFLR